MGPGRSKEGLCEFWWNVLNALFCFPDTVPSPLTASSLAFQCTVFEFYWV